MLGNLSGHVGCTVGRVTAHQASAWAAFVPIPRLGIFARLKLGTKDVPPSCCPPHRGQHSLGAPPLVPGAELDRWQCQCPPKAPRHSPLPTKGCTLLALEASWACVQGKKWRGVQAPKHSSQPVVDRELVERHLAAPLGVRVFYSSSHCPRGAKHCTLLTPHSLSSFPCDGLLDDSPQGCSGGAGRGQSHPAVLPRSHHSDPRALLTL